MLLLNLTITFSLLVMPFNIFVGIKGEYVFGNSDQQRCAVCQTGIFVIILPWVSLHTLALISVDRFIYLKRPMKYSTIVTKWRMLVTIAVMWVFCTVLFLPPLFGFGEINFSYTVATCTLKFVGKTHIAPNYNYICFVASYRRLHSYHHPLCNVRVDCLHHQEQSCKKTQKITEHW